MKLKKGKKSRKLRGSRYHGKSAKKHKGKGTSGGKGMSGSGKRADQKKTLVIRYRWPYFGKKAERKKRKKGKEINVGDIEKNLSSLLKKGIARKGKESIEINLEDYKILGNGEVKEKLYIKAKSFSNKAKEKIEKVGGKAITFKAGKEEKEVEEKVEKNGGG